MDRPRSYSELPSLYLSRGYESGVRPDARGVPGPAGRQWAGHAAGTWRLVTCNKNARYSWAGLIEPGYARSRGIYWNLAGRPPAPRSTPGCVLVGELPPVPVLPPRQDGAGSMRLVPAPEPQPVPGPQPLPPIVPAPLPPGPYPGPLPPSPYPTPVTPSPYPTPVTPSPYPTPTAPSPYPTPPGSEPYPTPTAPSVPPGSYPGSPPMQPGRLQTINFNFSGDIAAGAANEEVRVFGPVPYAFRVLNVAVNPISSIELGQVLDVVISPDSDPGDTTALTGASIFPLLQGGAVVPAPDVERGILLGAEAFALPMVHVVSAAGMSIKVQTRRRGGALTLPNVHVAVVVEEVSSAPLPIEPRPPLLPEPVAPVVPTVPTAPTAPTSGEPAPSVPTWFTVDPFIFYLTRAPYGPPSTS